MTEPGRWLIVVHREHLDLFHHLRDRFGELPFLEIVLDRRKGERRQVRAPVRPERRRAERRQPSTAKEREQWALFGHRLVRQGEPPRP